MAGNPNKPGTIAYTVWEQNQAKNTAAQKTAPVAPKSTGGVVVSGGPIATANAIQQQSAPKASMPVGGVTAPKPITTPTTISSVPKTDFSSYKFGQDAMNENLKDNTYLAKRNTDFATQYTTQGLKDYNSVYNELSKNVGFQGANQVDRDNTAKSIWEQMQKTQPTTPTAPTASIDGTTVPTGPQVETFSTGESYDAVNWDKAIGEATDPALKQELIRLKEQERVAKADVTATAGNIKTTSQRTLTDNQYAYDQKTKELNKQLDDAKLKIDRQIADIEKMTSRNIGIQEKSGALSGINRGAGFTQGLNNIKQDALETINRLQVDLNNYNNAVGEAKGEAYQVFMQNRDRAIEDFTYQYRNILDNTNTDLAKAVGKYPDLSSEKLRKEIAKIGESYTIKSQQATQNFINMQNDIQDAAWKDIENITKLQEFSNLQEDRLLNQWAGKDGSGYLTLSQNDLMDMVESGQIKQSTAMASINLMRSKAVSTINQLAMNGVATPAEVEEVMNGINSGMTPQQAISGVVGKNPARFTPMTKSTESRQKLNDNTLYNQATGEYKSMTGQPIQGASAGVSIPAVQQQIVENNIQQVQSIADGTIKGQCGSFVNDYLGSLGLSRLFEDPITQKSSITNSQEAKVGNVVVLDYGLMVDDGKGGKMNAGHVGIVIGTDPQTGRPIVKDSNYGGQKVGDVYQGDGKVQTRVLSEREMGQIKGFFDPRIGKQASTTSMGPNQETNSLAEYLIDFQPRGQGYSNDDVAAFTKVIEKYAERGDRGMMIQAYRDQILKDKGNRDKINAVATITNTVDRLQSLMKQYESQPGANMNIFRGNIQKLQEKLGTTGDPILSEIGQLMGKVTADYIKDTSGTAASDAEVQRLAKLLPSITSNFDRNLILSSGFKNSVSNAARTTVEVSMGKNKDMLDEVFPEFGGGEKSSTTTTTTTGTKGIKGVQGKVR